MTHFLDDTTKYRQMLEQGADPAKIYIAAKEDGQDRITCIGILRNLFGLDLAQAKEIMIITDGVAPSLTAYQDNLISDVALGLSNWGNNALIERAFQQSPTSTSDSTKKVSGL
jgi:hypothetical protein